LHRGSVGLYPLVGTSHPHSSVRVHTVYQFHTLPEQVYTQLTV